MAGKGKEISAGDVVDLLEQSSRGDGGEKFLIVDVRDEDFNEQGHIKTAINLPSNFFHEETMRELAQICMENATQTVIFHCAYSKVRGPSCRDRFALFCQKEGLIAHVEGSDVEEDSSSPPSHSASASAGGARGGRLALRPDIRITCMKGGFTTFAAQFAGTEYVETEV
jgi:hypothetical protein